MDRRIFLGCLGTLPAATTVAAAQAPAPPPKPGTAKSIVRITVVKRSTHQDLVDRFRKGGKAEPCNAFKDGQEFTLEAPWSPPEGFCQWAWADIRAQVMANFHGGDFPMVGCCTDGFRPVHFRIERVEVNA